MSELTGIELVWAAAAEPGEWACPHCDQQIKDQRKDRRGDWCKRCYDLWRKAGRPEDGPPLSFYEESALRRDEYLRLREWRVTREEAQARTGLSRHVVSRLEAERAKAGSKP